MAAVVTEGEIQSIQGINGRDEASGEAVGNKDSNHELVDDAREGCREVKEGKDRDGAGG